MSEPNVYEQLAGMTIERDAAQAISVAWVDWLARTGYGIDYRSDIDPPCTLTDLAKAWHRLDPDDHMTIDDWAWCITENTGAFVAINRIEDE